MHTVSEGDTCTSIADGTGITLTVLLANNPNVNTNCTNIGLGEVRVDLDLWQSYLLTHCGATGSLHRFDSYPLHLTIQVLSYCRRGANVRLGRRYYLVGIEQWEPTIGRPMLRHPYDVYVVAHNLLIKLIILNFMIFSLFPR